MVYKHIRILLKVYIYKYSIHLIKSLITKKSNIILFFLLNIKLTLFNYTFIGYSWFIDVTSRLSLNESILNLYNFFWTSLTYLPSFYFLFFLIVLYYLLFWKNLLYVLIFTLIFIFYNIELVNYVVLNYNYTILDNNNSTINILLLNNLNKYHPFIFYLSSIMFFIFLIELLFIIFSLNNFSKNLIIININYYKYFIFFINIFTLYLGSWWALQEGTWGGWWNWDPSEVFGLLFGLSTLIFIHSKVKIFNIYFSSIKISLIGLFIVVSYFFIQLNFDLVSHNFGSKFFFFFNNNLFFLESIFLLISICIIININIINLYCNNIILNYNYKIKSSLAKSEINIFKLLSYLIFLGIILLIIISFMSLINYFFWNFAGLNIFNTEFDNKKIIILFFVIMLYLLFTYNNILVLNVLTLNMITYNWFIVLIFFTKLKKSLITVIHYILLLFLIQNIWSYTTNFIYWFDIINIKEYYYTNSFYSKVNSYFICNTFNIDFVDLYQNENFNYFISWNTLYSSNIPLNTSFYLNFSNTNFFNLYKLNFNWQSIYLYIETLYLNNLNYLFWGIILIFLIFI